ncbi:dipeptidase [Acidocella aminolytica 101 = DSM 11237]|jgi:membrane dipeptidase|uniref:Dipeptidase n=2 Tax=Acidocella TaxID=50709 RepID=A0A0D6PAT0_9PROT|nr:dipeptidase [Acidocella aminolytica]GAN78860.1 dipeptidase [Acidocella aminolytica 101 = DSM 11237]GBQ33195.1 dipeptidase [Acidocella aminolytica 101 = DSM 11237]
MTNDLHDGLLAIDTHVDIPWPEGPSPFEDGPRCVDLPKLRRGRVGAVCFAAYIPQGHRDGMAHLAAAERARAMLAAIAEMAPKDGSGGMMATSAAGVEAAFAAGKPAVIPAIENGYAIGRSLALLDEFAGLGIRYMTLTHNGHNEIADAAIPLPSLNDVEQEYSGLSDFGQSVVERMNELGVLIDVSHASKNTMMQAAQRSRTPVVATHSCMRALCDHKRNLDDEQLEMLASTGGLAQITIVSSFLRPKARASDLTVDDIVDHVDYAVKRMGIDHVGIGTDFDGGGGVRGFMNAAEAPNLTAALARRGYGRLEIEKIWGGNFLRLMRKAEEAAG